ncbi:p21-activated protein kinase-interacting protein 1-like [Stomoxys calcitrans]|uniref:p21-activated protein kinase-interacting protein 1-like n=1 Tax=Stomoxys calcitrans TaxID=35570 RepID=UPI0027E2D0BC|nr:p21-activated protein kinase-interacting protein 1-like [Stomoxys calcitrans]
MEIIVGTYENFLLGYKVDIKVDKPSIVQSFADRSHSGSIRCVAVKDQWIATGATDDRIFIYDMSTRKQAQIILSHDGTINSLAFTPDGTHLLSAGDDGRMIATRLKTWFTDATWKKAHSGSAVTHVSCHPSGKLALSLGSDLVLRTWNLVKGRVAYKTNLKSRNTLGRQPDCLTWSPNGDYFTLSGQRVVEFWSIKTADVARSQKTKSKPTCLSWISDEECLVGLEDGKILWLNVNKEEDNDIEIPAYMYVRVKVMQSFKNNLITASSFGEIKVWQIVANKRKLKEVAKANIGCRPTCLSVLDLEQFGANYVISSTIEEVKDIKPTGSKAKAPPRGVVTIEYDDDDNEDSDSNSKSDHEEESDEEEVTEGEEEENDNDSAAEVSDDDENEDDVEEPSSEPASTNSEEDEQNAEPVMRLPKSRKHKLQLMKMKSNTNKKQKMDNYVKPQQTINKAKNKQKNKK